MVEGQDITSKTEDAVTGYGQDAADTRATPSSEKVKEAEEDLKDTPEENPGNQSEAA